MYVCNCIDTATFIDGMSFILSDHFSMLNIILLIPSELYSNECVCCVFKCTVYCTFICLYVKLMRHPTGGSHLVINGLLHHDTMLIRHIKAGLVNFGVKFSFLTQKLSN